MADDLPPVDFYVRIEALPDAQLRIEVTDSPSGRGAIQLLPPFSDDELSRINDLLSGKVNASPAEEARLARAFGEKLFTMVFAESLARLYDESVKQARAVGVRFVFDLSAAGRWAEIPWELLRDPRGELLTTAPRTTFVRSIAGVSSAAVLEVALPIQVLVIVASPADQPTVDVNAEWSALEELTSDLRARGLLALERVENAQLITLQRKLRAGKPFQIVHYIGLPTGDQPARGTQLVLEDPRRRTLAITGAEFTRELAEENSVRLALLTTPAARRQELDADFKAVAGEMLRAGMPAVLAMDHAMGADAHRLFVQEFYRLLVEGYTLEQAITGARRTVTVALGSLDGAAPSLFAGTHGYLFPKRKLYRGRPSLGGLRESPLLTLVGLLLVVLFAIGGFVATRQPVVTVTPPPTGKIDLAIVGMRFSPAKPAPGEVVRITLQIRNQGDAPSGPFQWTFYTQDPTQGNISPALTGTVANVSPGITHVARSEFVFGGWGAFLTTAFVNETLITPETSIVNNSITRALTTDISRPFSIDFQFLSTGAEVLEQTDLSGNEFDEWRMKFSPVITDQACAGAVLRITLAGEDGERRQLSTGLKGQPTGCDSLPIRIGLGQPISDLAAGSGSVQILPSKVGVYRVRVLDASAQTELVVSTKTVTEAQLDQPLEIPITLPKQSAQSTLSNTIIEISPPLEAPLVLLNVTLEPAP